MTTLSTGSIGMTALSTGSLGMTTLSTGSIYVEGCSDGQLALLVPLPIFQLWTNRRKENVFTEKKIEYT